MFALGLQTPGNSDKQDESYRGKQGQRRHLEPVGSHPTLLPAVHG